MATDIPDPEQTSDGPAYEGRLLPRPDDEIVDQGASFDVGTLLSRRAMLSILGLGAGATLLAACTPISDASTGDGTATDEATTSEGEIPEETNGPYPADGSQDVDVLDDSGIVRSDIATSIGDSEVVAGVPLALTFTLLDMANGDAPFEGAAIYAWQCDAQGRYSMYSEGVEDQTFLRGVQAADADGKATFQTIVPACYAGRWTHIHFEVYPDVDSITDHESVIATSQLAFPPEVLADVYALEAYAGSTENLAGVGTEISDDGLFGEGDWSLQAPTVTGDAASGYAATLSVGIDTTTEPSAGGEGGPGEQGGPDGQGGPDEQGGADGTDQPGTPDGSGAPTPPDQP